MGRHSIRGISTGLELNVTGRDSRRLKTHRIAGGEYVTQLFWVNKRRGAMVSKPVINLPTDLLTSYVEDAAYLTFSIAPQGPYSPIYCDVRCSAMNHHHGQPSVGQWRRPHYLGRVIGSVTVDYKGIPAGLQLELDEFVRDTEILVTGESEHSKPHVHCRIDGDSFLESTGFQVTGSISGSSDPLPGDDKVTSIIKYAQQKGDYGFGETY